MGSATTVVLKGIRNNKHKKIIHHDTNPDDEVATC